MRLRRRSFVTTLAAATTPALFACTGKGGSGPSHSPSSPSPVPECVELSPQHLRAANDPCAGQDGTGADGDVRQLEWFGPISTHDDVAVAWYRNLLVEWSLADGAARRALAPRRASGRAYALVGGAVVTPTCEGSLAIHMDACLSRTIKPDAALAQLCGLDEASFLVLGTEGTLLRLDLEGKVLARADVPTSPGATFIAVDTSTGVVSVSSATTASLVDASTLELRDRLDSLPPSRAGWHPTSDGQLAGLGEALYRHDVASGSTETFEAHSRAVLAVGPKGTIAAIQGVDWTVLPRGAGPQVVRVARGVSTHPHAAIAADGTVLALDALRGMTSVDPGTGDRNFTFHTP